MKYEKWTYEYNTNMGKRKKNLIFPLSMLADQFTLHISELLDSWNASLLKTAHIQNDTRVPLEIEGHWDAIALEIKENRSYMYVRDHYVSFRIKTARKRKKIPHLQV